MKGLRLGLSMVGASTFDPLSLAPSAWYDPSDLSTMFQDSAGTIPVAADGDPVGKMLDKSGNGNHIAQATSASRPLYKTSGGISWVEFDGADDSLSVNSAALRIVGDLTISLGAYKNSGGSFCGLITCETNAGTTNPYELRFSNHATVEQLQLAAANGTTVETVDDSAPGTVLNAPAAGVFSARRTVGSSIEFSVNKIGKSYVSTMVPTSDANSTFVMGNRHGDSGIPLAGRIYGALVFNSLVAASDLSNLETWLGTKSGLTI